MLELSSAEHFRKLAEGPKGRGCASGMCPVSAVIEKLYGALMCSGYKRYASVMPTLIAIAYEQGVAASIPCSLWLARYNTSSVYDQASHLLWCALYHLYARLVRIPPYAAQIIEDDMDDPLAHAASYNGSVPRFSPR